MVHASSNKAGGKITVFVQHVSFCYQEVRGDGGARGSRTGLLSTGAIGEEIFPLERKQAMGVIRVVIVYCGT